MKIEILPQALQDLEEGSRFYEALETGLGEYFLDSLFASIDALLICPGIHPTISGYHRSLSQKFPFAIYYAVDGSTIRVVAVLDCRRRPAWTRKRLRTAL